MEQNAVDNQQFESFPELHETPEEIAFELRAQEGALWTGGRLAHRHLGLRLRRAGLRLLLPPLGQQRESVAARGGSRRPPRSAPPSSPSRWRAALLVQYGERRFRETRPWTGRSPAGRPSSADCSPSALQIWQLTSLPFFPGSSGYASCFIGWAAMNIALLLCGHLLARDDPGPRDPAPAGHGPGRGGVRARRCRWPACSGST